ncbi:hypothetical protein [Microlunatus endophyticus]
MSARTRTVAFALLVLGAIAVVAMATVPWYYVDSRTRFSGTAITGESPRCSASPSSPDRC